MPTLDVTRPWRVGLCWAGSPQHKNDTNRSLPTRAFDTLFDLGGRVEFVSLQKGAREDEYPEAQTVTVTDYLDTGRVVNSLDLVITVDTSVAHLAGAMGKPVWTLVAALPDFRWLTDREDTPWYASMRLFRQERLGSWTGVVSRVKAELTYLVERKEAA